MAGKLRTTLFLLALFDAAMSNEGSPTKRNGRMPVDFIMFLNTTEDIWTYYSTLKLPFKCKKDVISNISNTDVQLNESFLRKHVVEKFSHHGRLGHSTNSESDPRNLMFITEYYLNYNRKDVRYQTLDEKCVVIEVTRWDSTDLGTYDLLVWNSAIKKGMPPKSCKKKFSEYAKSRHQNIYTIYHDYCPFYYKKGQ
ncbi:uncharacterized protein LOC119459549 [Dermacentor silvarum]|uniref:uncharacterized protein LOC119459549 n=1 Tax=Dermacentor silvarum TaxID=543639 RepID=UPI0018972A2D|nr:uncharacterized protein LOC119459549 [Dermacentor silvarum]